VFGASPEQAKTYQVRTKAEVEALFADSSFAYSDQLRFVELYMPREDAPAALKMTAEASAKNNAKLE
jgi:pyruvate decarboxylase